MVTNVWYLIGAVGSAAVGFLLLDLEQHPAWIVVALAGAVGFLLLAGAAARRPDNR